MSHTRLSVRPCSSWQLSPLVGAFVKYWLLSDLWWSVNYLYQVILSEKNLSPCFIFPWFPYRMGNLETGSTFSSQRKVGEFWTYWKSNGNLPKVLERRENFSQFFSDCLIKVYLLNRSLHLLNSLNKTLKKYWKMEKNTGKVREICQSEKVGTMITGVQTEWNDISNSMDALQHI